MTLRDFFIQELDLTFEEINLALMPFDVPSDGVCLFLEDSDTGFKAGNLILVIFDSGFEEGQFVSQGLEFSLKFVDGLKAGFSCI